MQLIFTQLINWEPNLKVDKPSQNISDYLNLMKPLVNLLINSLTIMSFKIGKVPKKDSIDIYKLDNQ